MLRLIPDLRVLAVEPNPTLFKVLEERFMDKPTVDLLNVAIGSQRGTAPFFITGSDHNSSLLPPRKGMDRSYGGGWNVDQEVPIEVITLQDAVGNRRVPLVKVDIQGGERAMLEGAGDALDDIGAVLIEMVATSHYEGDASMSFLHEELCRHGFALYGISEPRRDISTGAILWFDACYARLNDGPL
jgi:FkbM family methyltransferase